MNFLNDPRARAAAMLAEIHQSLRRQERAATPENIAQANEFLGHAIEFLENNNAEQALRLVERADELNVSVRDLEYVRSMCLYSLGKKSEAIKAAFHELLDYPDNEPVVAIIQQMGEETGARVPSTAEYVQSWKRAGKPAPIGKKLRVGMITPWHVRCGIGSYVQEVVLNTLDPEIEYVVFARHDSQLVAPDTSQIRRCWYDLTQREDNLETLFNALLAEKIDLVNVQFGPSSFRIPALGKMLRKLKERRIGVFLTIHSSDSAEVLGELSPSIDQVICLQGSSYERLTQIFGAAKVTQSNLPITIYPRTPVRVVQEQRAKLRLDDTFLIATHGFLLPNKGLETLLQAIGLLKQRGVTNLKFLSVTSRHEKPELTDQTLAACNSVIESFGIQDQFILVDDYLERRDIHQLLQLADLLVFCYGSSPETASVAVCQSIQTRVPILTSPLSSFRDIENFSRAISAITPEALGEEIVKYMNDKERDVSQLAARALYLNNTSTKVVVSELESEMKRVTSPQSKQAAPARPVPASVYPKISIVTPSLNCARYIRRCIAGVMAQNYPNCEHIIVDGASTDGTVDILKEYPHVKWISEPDNGKAEAINKGLKMASGDIINWLDVDNEYFDSNALHTVAEAFVKNPDAGVFYGKCLVVNEKGEVVMFRSPLNPVTLAGLMHWYANLNFSQPAMFYTAKLAKDIGMCREDLSFAIEYEYWLRIAAKGHRYHYIDRMLAKAALGREAAISGNSVEDRHKNLQEIAAGFETHLIRPERINYWRDFYLYRVRNPLNYQEPVPIPQREEELIGMTFALLEIGDVSNAAGVLNELISKFPPCPDVYWLTAEVQHRAGQGSDSLKTAEMGKSMQLQNP